MRRNVPRCCHPVARLAICGNIALNYLAIRGFTKGFDISCRGNFWPIAGILQRVVREMDAGKRKPRQPKPRGGAS
jgi:hypothetical protein